MPYIGRFAPSPTGHLHFGSLVAAMGSYLQARKASGKWLLRIEDLDPPREKPGTSDHIINTLEQFGFEWDDDIIYQSNNIERYQDALDKLRRSGLLYHCDCTRKKIIREARHTDSGYVYAGTCRNKTSNLLGPNKATRLKVPVSGSIGIADLIQGIHEQDLATDVGDFILQRRDGLWSYQLAVVVDDAAENITEVVRGADLLDNTARQIYLQQLLGLPTPNYAHLPIAVDATGAKLSKQTFAESLDPADKFTPLYAAWHFLGQTRVTPPEQTNNLQEFWTHACQHWDVSRVPTSHLATNATRI